jgi:hypothetical protein
MRILFLILLLLLSSCRHCAEPVEPEDSSAFDTEFSNDFGEPYTTESPITMDFVDIPLREVIRYICESGNLQYKVDWYAVTIGNFSYCDISTEYWQLTPEMRDIIPTRLYTMRKRGLSLLERMCRKRAVFSISRDGTCS